VNRAYTRRWAGACATRMRPVQQVSLRGSQVFPWRSPGVGVARGVDGVADASDATSGVDQSSENSQAGGTARARAIWCAWSMSMGWWPFSHRLIVFRSTPTASPRASCVIRWPRRRLRIRSPTCSRERLIHGSTGSAAGIGPRWCAHDQNGVPPGGTNELRVMNMDDRRSRHRLFPTRPYAVAPCSLDRCVVHRYIRTHERVNGD
jgi:hypothetical protein